MADSTLDDLEARVGHPGQKWIDLRERIQLEGLIQFADVTEDWLDLMWSLDQYRIAGRAPRGMGKVDVAEADRLGAIYRGKGDWFASAIALLVGNRTAQELSARSKVEGFSQLHQIDVAWPRRRQDVLVCAETKVTGAPATGSRPARKAMSDFSNRRKELKFASVDLKLYRRSVATPINHWQSWRQAATPKMYFLWGARLSDGEQPARLIEELRALRDSYLEGVGLLAWRQKPDRSGYEAVALPHAHRTLTLDDVLDSIGSEITAMTGADRRAPGPRPPRDDRPDVISDD